MTSLLFLAPAGAGIAVALTLVVPRESGEKLARAIGIIGAGFGIALFVAADGLGGWRSLATAPIPAAIAAAAAATAWVVAAAGPDPRSEGVLVGAAGAALGLFAAGAWVVPALLFLACALGAVAAMGRGRPGRHLAWLFVAAAGVAVGGAFGFAAWDSGGWRLVTPDGALLWLGVGGALAAIGVVPVAVWQLAGGGAPAAVPLTVGVGFVALSRLGPVDQPWVAVAIIAVALALALGAWIARLEVPVVGSWSAATLAGIVVAAPDTAVAAGGAAVLTAGAVALWPDARGRGRMSRGLLLSFAPPTAGFAALLAAEGRAFATATGPAPDLAWAALAAGLPLTLGAGVVLGGVAARTAVSDDFEPRAVVATWGLLAATIALGTFGSSVAALPTLVARADLPLIYSVALVAGAVAGSRAPAAETPAEAIVESRRSGVIVLPRWLARFVDAAAAVLALAIAGGVAWLTLEGLSVGFL